MSTCEMSNSVGCGFLVCRKKDNDGLLIGGPMSKMWKEEGMSPVDGSGAGCLGVVEGQIH